MKLTAEERVLQRLGLDYEVPESGCCGMAGAFGFEGGDHYEVSIACGERVLLPKVREAGADTLVVANGFSCRKQIELTTDRRALHLAHVLDLAQREADGARLPARRPERALLPAESRDPTKGEALLAIGVGLAAVGAAGWWLAQRRRRRARFAAVRQRSIATREARP
jgi:hypothetical protein